MYQIIYLPDGSALFALDLVNGTELYHESEVLSSREQFRSQFRDTFETLEECQRYISNAESIFEQGTENELFLSKKTRRLLSIINLTTGEPCN